MRVVLQLQLLPRPISTCSVALSNLTPSPRYGSPNSFYQECANENGVASSTSHQYRQNSPSTGYYFRTQFGQRLLAGPRRCQTKSLSITLPSTTWRPVTR